MTVGPCGPDRRRRGLDSGATHQSPSGEQTLGQRREHPYTWATRGFSRPQAAIMATIATATTTTGSVLANPEPEIRCATLCYAGPNAQS